MKDRRLPTLSYQLLSDHRSELMGVAMLWIMLFHAYNYKFHQPILDGIKTYGYLGVDIFIFLSGLGLAMSLLRKPEPIPFWKARAKRILPTYWIVVGGYSLLLFLQNRLPFSTLLWNLTCLHYWFQIPGSFNWYLSALLVFYLLAPLWVWCLKKCGHPAIPTLLAFPLAYGLYKLSIPMGFSHISDFLFRIPAFGFGLFCGYNLYTGRKLSRSHLCMWLLLAAGAGGLGYMLVTGIKYIPPCFVFSLCLCPFCLLVAWLLELTTIRWRPLALIGECSLEIYLFNVIFTREYDTLLAWTSLAGHPLRYYLVACSANLVLGILLHKLLSKLPWASKKSPATPAKG